MEVPLITDYEYYECKESKIIFAKHKKSKYIWALWEGGGWYGYKGWHNIEGLSQCLSPLFILLKVGFCPESAQDIEHHIKFIDNRIRYLENYIEDLEYGISSTFDQQDKRQTELFKLQAERKELKKRLAKINTPKHKEIQKTLSIRQVI